MPEKRTDSDKIRRTDNPFDHAAVRNTLAAMLVVVATAIACLHPFQAPLESSERLVIPWIAAQSMAFVFAIWLIGRPFVRPSFGWSVAVEFACLIAIPTIMLLDSITYGWTRERFFSATTYGAITEHGWALLQHASSGTISGGVWLGTCWLISVVTLVTVSLIAAKRQRFITDKRFAAFAILCFVASIPSVLWPGAAVSSMRTSSSRHPFCIFRVVSPDRGSPNNQRGPGDPSGPGDRGGRSSLITDGTASEVVPQTGDVLRDAQDLRDAIAARSNRHRLLRVVGEPAPTSPDVLIVVAESFRHELVSKDVMPHLWRFAEQGIHCRQHFSGGNATNHGMFSLLNGLESVWYDTDVRFTPIMNRLMRQAGYELGFFAGHDDWRLFRMDGYIRDECYDVFQTSKPDGMASDRLATERAASFLDRADLRGDKSQSRPRLAVLYLYATHADYQSYLEDQVFQPAADDRFLIPFTLDRRDQVWNRYKNSARSVDRLLSAVMREDRIVIVTGDHGESFLDDGVCGHGIRISKFQNMTPAVLYRPGGRGTTIDHPTMHADLLPSLLSILGIATNDPDTLDGVSLFDQHDTFLRDRVFATRNYLSDDIAVIAPSERDDEVFGYRGRFSIREFEAKPINAIDETGQPIRRSADMTAKWWQDWLNTRFGRR